VVIAASILTDEVERLFELAAHPAYRAICASRLVEDPLL
jgi:hypothetical protein